MVMVYYLLGLLSAVVYPMVGVYVAGLFDELDSTEWVLAWPVVVAWLVDVLIEERVSQRRWCHVG